MLKRIGMKLLLTIEQMKYPVAFASVPYRKL
jgi:hypothetical protein